MMIRKMNRVKVPMRTKLKETIRTVTLRMVEEAGIEPVSN
jgi:hypothetical protein